MKYEVLHLKDCFSFLGKDGADPTVEIYLPYNMSQMKREKRKRPCMVVCPGGGYVMCSQCESEPIAMNFLPEGYNVFVITYSVSPHRFPTQIIEVAALMELIYKNADKWNCDTEKISIIGFSAGGHLAAHYSTNYNCREIRTVFPKSKPVNAAILCYPVITADYTFANVNSIVNLLGHDPKDEKEQNKFSCESLVGPNTPPAFIWHTAEDSIVPVENSLLYAASLSKYNIPFEMHIYPFGQHGLSTCDDETCDALSQKVAHCNDWIADVKKWLKITFSN